MEKYIDKQSKCQIEECNKTYDDELLDIHYIVYKCLDNIDNIEYKKNKINNYRYNLVTLCKLHHKLLHNEILEIYGYNINNNMKLDYKYMDNDIKYNLDNIINYIKEYVEKYCKRSSCNVKILQEHINKDLNLNIKNRDIIGKIFDIIYT